MACRASRCFALDRVLVAVKVLVGGRERLLRLPLAGVIGLYGHDVRVHTPIITIAYLSLAGQHANSVVRASEMQCKC